MIDSIGLPLKTLVFTAAGVAIAVGWYDWNRYLLLGVCVAIVVAMLLFQSYAKSQIVKNPVRALGFLELRVASIGAATAILGAVSTVIGVEFAAADGTPEPNKSLITAAVGALTAFVASVSITSDKMDSSIGDYVQRSFRKAFQAGNVKDTTIFAAGSLGEIALYTKYFAGWTDWSRENRRARAEALEEALINLHPSGGG